MEILNLFNFVVLQSFTGGITAPARHDTPEWLEALLALLLVLIAIAAVLLVYLIAKVIHKTIKYLFAQENLSDNDKNGGKKI